MPPLFCPIDDRLKYVPKHPGAELYPGDSRDDRLLVYAQRRTIPALLSLAPARVLALVSLLAGSDATAKIVGHASNWADRFLAAPTFFTVTDNYGIELIHPMREGRSEKQIGRKGKAISAGSSASNRAGSSIRTGAWWIGNGPLPTSATTVSYPSLSSTKDEPSH